MKLLFLSKRFCAVLTLVAVICSGCATQESNRINFESLTATLLAMISDKRTSDHDLQEAISRLGKVAEAPTFWSRIASDSTYSTMHRRRCVMALLQRHRGKAETVGSLSNLLDKPTWLRDEDITIVTAVIGWIPVEWTPEDTVFVIKVLPDSSPNWSAAYIRVAGKVDRNEFSRIIRSDRSTPLTGDQLILEVGVHHYDKSPRADLFQSLEKSSPSQTI